ncbi:MAG: 30S ribosomal protein S7, partial [Chloroflexi bacterium]|nr:30S ribosomal protein S7 [Chloroflexota bacterium]
MRRNRAPVRPTFPDPRFGSRTVSKLINMLMLSGKKGTAEKIVYTAFDRIEEVTGRQGIEVFDQALRNVTPVIEVKPRRVGGATYQVPIDIRGERR